MSYVLDDYSETYWRTSIVFRSPSYGYLRLRSSLEGLSIRESRFGIFGKTLFSGSPLQRKHAAWFLQTLERADIAPEIISNSVLRRFSNVIINANSLVDVRIRLSYAKEFSINVTSLEGKLRSP